jgi:flagellar protein FlaG
MDIRSLNNVTQPLPSAVDAKQADAAPVQSSAQPILAQAVTGASESQATPPTPEQLKQAVDSINQAFSAMSSDIQFSIDQDSNRAIIKVVDQKTKEVVRQIPSAEALAIAKSLEEADQTPGLLISQKA